MFENSLRSDVCVFLAFTAQALNVGPPVTRSSRHVVVGMLVA
jgi:hypothetical protein